MDVCRGIRTYWKRTDRTRIVNRRRLPIRSRRGPPRDNDPSDPTGGMPCGDGGNDYEYHQDTKGHGDTKFFCFVFLVLLGVLVVSRFPRRGGNVPCPITDRDTPEALCPLWTTKQRRKTGGDNHREHGGHGGTTRRRRRFGFGLSFSVASFSLSGPPHARRRRRMSEEQNAESTEQNKKGRCPFVLRVLSVLCGRTPLLPACAGRRDAIRTGQS